MAQALRSETSKVRGNRLVEYMVEVQKDQVQRTAAMVARLTSPRHWVARNTWHRPRCVAWWSVAAALGPSWALDRLKPPHLCWTVFGTQAVPNMTNSGHDLEVFEDDPEIMPHTSRRWSGPT